MAEIPVEQLADEVGTIGHALEQAPLPGAMERCAEILREGILLNFERSAGPAGPWPPRKDNLPHPLLIKSGDLKAAATEKGASGAIEHINGREVQVGVEGTSVPYAATHQFGRGPIPARPYHDVDEVFLDECREVLADELVELIG